MTIKPFFCAPALFNPSKAKPALNAPSPTTHITFELSLFISFAALIPNPADTAVGTRILLNEKYR